MVAFCSDAMLLQVADGAVASSHDRCTGYRSHAGTPEGPKPSPQAAPQNIVERGRYAVPEKQGLSLVFASAPFGADWKPGFCFLRQRPGLILFWAERLFRGFLFVTCHRSLLRPEFRKPPVGPWNPRSLRETPKP